MKEEMESNGKTVPQSPVASTASLTDGRAARVGAPNEHTVVIGGKGILAAYNSLRERGYSTVWSGNGQICMEWVKPTLSKQEQFFYDNAGFSHNPEIESTEQGRVRCAQRLALAENWLRDADGIECEVSPDPYSDESFMDGESDEYKAEWSGKAWCVRLYSDSDPSLASLGSCYGDKKYERVVIAELALEIMPEVL